MAALAPCGGCSFGNHARHVEHWDDPGPGILGGAFCNCPGNCTTPDLTHIFNPTKENTMPNQTNILAKSARVLHHHGTSPDPYTPTMGRLVTFKQMDDDTGAWVNQVVISERDWVEFGSPATITVTIEPGDLLNPAPCINCGRPTAGLVNTSDEPICAACIAKHRR